MQQNIARISLRKEATRVAYNRMSRCYDFLAGRLERKYVDAGLQMLGPTSEETILEIGFGTGYAIVAMARSVGGSGKVYGIDISDAMLRKAGLRVSKAGLANRVVLQRGDAVKLPYKDAFFDSIFMSFTLELFDTTEIPTVLKECERVLKDDGYLCAVALSKKDEDSFMVRLYERVHRMFPRYVDCRPIFVRQTLEESGFRTINITEMPMKGLPVCIILSCKETTTRDTSAANSDKGYA
jgi:demethylmenaquinone methyltransferase/2-methoxy-6-polyprenyl-1,4-benzoquinol methylase